MSNPVVHLSDYNSDWEKLFDFEKKQIIGVIGDKIKDIEHIGSTSIKGLLAKPIIDIMIGVDDLNLVSTFITALSEIEFEYIPKPELKDRYFFKKDSGETSICHLHICKMNSYEWTEKLLFRDYLRENPKVAKDYALLKSELASKYKYDRPTYTKEKEPFIKEIIQIAKD
ncbi:GrpB family protein [Saliterribacillus persicus]|uniref:GrpB-like predicted nucleotidyltransferase (UPF0157 family) n=1 Tax=Saliterribacillus persicus TaxID=930114 RepID=A0A368YFB4_9BACI|nr:GrpB family protein [Saliterribacillus persicus]RCW76874.1 GrpB-like predicted nucleotidyltransferase (UPF0157 family) [Saliterribacillus persicus]